MLDKPYIHYIGVKIMNTSAGNHWTDILIRQQETTEPPYNDMFIKDVNMNIANGRILLL
jgi:hypothetical protein